MLEKSNGGLCTAGEVKDIVILAMGLGEGGG